jgi:voltage-gated potassium channel
MSDQTRLERFEQRTEWLMAAVALMFLGCYSVQVLAEPHGFSDMAMRAVMAGLYLAEPRGRWFLRNLVDLAIVVLPMFRPLRLLSLAVVLEVLQRAVGHSIRGRVAAYTAGGVVMIVYAASLAVLDVERHAPHAQITSFGDAVWWAVSTVTTVGYGDLTPVTLSGRLIAVALMIAGISLLGVVTATLASWIVEKVAEEDTANQAATAAHIEELREEIRKMRDAMRSDAD